MVESLLMKKVMIELKKVRVTHASTKINLTFIWANLPSHPLMCICLLFIY